MSEKFIEAGSTGEYRLLLYLDVRDEVRAMGARLYAHLSRADAMLPLDGGAPSGCQECFSAW